jgi:transcriptional regulator with XRE-family HTH domain
MPTLKEAVAANLRRLLQSKPGLSGRELAKNLDLTEQTVSAYLNARSGITSDTVAKLAAFFEVEETDLTAPPPGSQSSPAQSVDHALDDLRAAIEHEREAREPALLDDVRRLMNTPVDPSVLDRVRAIHERVAALSPEEIPEGVEDLLKDVRGQKQWGRVASALRLILANVDDDTDAAGAPAGLGERVEKPKK